jgi:hypothetical protein
MAITFTIVVLNERQLDEPMQCSFPHKEVRLAITHSVTEL